MDLFLKTNFLDREREKKIKKRDREGEAWKGKGGKKGGRREEGREQSMNICFLKSF